MIKNSLLMIYVWFKCHNFTQLSCEQLDTFSNPGNYVDFVRMCWIYADRLLFFKYNFSKYGDIQLCHSLLGFYNNLWLKTFVFSCVCFSPLFRYYSRISRLLVKCDFYWMSFCAGLLYTLLRVNIFIFILRPLQDAAVNADLGSGSIAGLCSWILLCLHSSTAGLALCFLRVQSM